MLFQLILIVVLVIVVSAVSSLMEAVLYSTPLSHIEALERTKKMGARKLKILKHDIYKPITAILTLNTISTTMGAALVGSFAVATFGEEALAWFSAVFTLAILLFTEILPKTIGAVYAKPLAPWVAYPLTWMVKILSPFIWLCRIVTMIIPAHKGQHLVSAEEVRAITALSRKSGEIDPQQENVINNILKLSHKYVRQAMTPRTVTYTLQEDLLVKGAMKKMHEWHRHSRIPVYSKDYDDIVGIVMGKDILKSAAEGKGGKPLSTFMQPVHFVPESAPLNRILLEFFEYHQHLFVVVDEYGGVTGVISLEDIIEEIVGREIMDETDQTRDMREFARIKRKKLTEGAQK